MMDWRLRLFYITLLNIAMCVKERILIAIISIRRQRSIYDQGAAGYNKGK